MGKIDWYLAAVVWRSTLLVLLVIVGIDALSAFIDESDSRSDRYGFSEIGRYVLLTLPGRCYEFVPFAALVGSMIGLGQLASAGELVVLRAAGLSKFRLTCSVLMQAGLLAVTGFLVGEYLAPVTEQRAQSLRSVALYNDQRVSIEQGIWQRDGRSFMQVSALTLEQEVFGVRFYQLAASGGLEQVIRAEAGSYADGVWQLEDVVATVFRRSHVVTSVSASLEVPSNVTPQVLALENVEPEQLSLRDLRGYSQFLQTQGDDAAEFRLAMWSKLLQPLAVAALVLVAVSFVFGPLRDGTLGFRLFTGVMLGVLFWLTKGLLGPASLVFGFPPLYAAAAPIAILLLLGLLLLGRSA
ncbi:MAG: LPS export ABC transporter permease LptG [Pseudomonadota bacterium]